MIDLQIAQIARIKQEEMLRSLPPVYDSDVWVAHEVDNGQARWMGTLFSSLVRGLTSVVKRLKHKSALAPDFPLTAQERSDVPG
jgi:hypothetical protein